MNTITLNNGRIIGDGQKAYIIAEMSANHSGDFERAIEIIKAAKAAGADCLKIQTYTPETITIDCKKEYFQIKDGLWNKENLFELYGKAFTPWEWQERIKEEVEKCGMDFLSTPFDKTAVDFLESIGTQFYKIASFELVDIPLIKYIASKQKPVIMSTGMGSIGEIEEAVAAVRSMGNDKLILLKCSSAYPAVPTDMNLKTINVLKQTFGLPVGLSDHSMGHIGALTAVACGANVIEKHFCISRAIKNPDSEFSMEPDEFKEMIETIRIAEKAIGTVNFEVSESESKSKKFRKSIFVVKDVKKGDIITEDNIRVIRPSDGLAPKYYDDILGKTFSEDVEYGEPLKWHMVK